MYTSRDARSSDEKPWAALGAWFLGPKGENGGLFQRLVKSSIDAHLNFREAYFPCDPIYVTDEVKASQCYKRTVAELEKQLRDMSKKLENSVPFFTSRYKGHVLWDTVMPANLGYITSLLYNQNNCAQEASVMTVAYETEVGKQLCGMLGYDPVKSMGHLVTGGSVANQEAIWAARNLKYYPLAVQEALKKRDELAGARGYKVLVPEVGRKVPLIDATQWQLLNLDVGTICGIPEEVAKLAKITESELKSIMKKYVYECIGAHAFITRHQLTTAPVVIAGSTCHVSILKGANITGIGKEQVITIPVDERARCKVDELKEILESKLRKKIPVLSVVSIMGTTEESAVDPLADILDLRKEMRVKGLNFVIHGDGAWGGYFASMLRDVPKDFYLAGIEAKPSGFVPELMLSSYVTKHIGAFGRCDTITVDPHKSGFCPYPAGATCYRDKRMNNFLNITGDVLYYHGKMNLGDVGIEGSKPGAAAAGVLLAHRVIGLHKDGYGRILAECTFTAKMLYCAWVTMAKADDNYTVVLTQDFPEPEKRQKYIDFIEKRILNRPNEELIEDKEAMEFLREIGPDTLIPCFAVNLKSNDDVAKCNSINDNVFKHLVHTDKDMSAQRTPLIVTASTMSHHRNSNALNHFKENLGLDTSNKSLGVKYIVTTCLDPWTTSMDFIDDLVRIMKNAIRCAIGKTEDPTTHHDFVSSGSVESDGDVIVAYAGKWKRDEKKRGELKTVQSEHSYFTMAKLHYVDDTDARNVRSKVQKLDQPIVFRNQNPDKLHDVLMFDPEPEKGEEEGELKRRQREEVFDVFSGFPPSGTKIKTAKMKVVDVPRFIRFDPSVTSYPKFSVYFMYGEKDRAYISHVPAKYPDFQQLVELARVPKDVSRVILQHGIMVQLLTVSGTPKLDGAGNVINPLTGTEYRIRFTGEKGVEMESSMTLGRTIWFEGNMLDSSTSPSPHQ